MKPLELTWYPLDRSYPTGYRLPRDTRVSWQSADTWAKIKRLTDAELAAEYYRIESDLIAQYGGYEPSDCGGWDTKFSARVDRVNTLGRFIFSPNYDEED